MQVKYALLIVFVVLFLFCSFVFIVYLPHITLELYPSYMSKQFTCHVLLVQKIGININCIAISVHILF